MARPSRGRSEKLELRVSRAEKALFEERATEAGQPVSEFIRRTCLGEATAAPRRAPGRKRQEAAARRRVAAEKARAALAAAQVGSG